MASVSGWTHGHPSAISRRRDYPAQARSDKSIARRVWLQEHYHDDGSADSAGQHKLGSGRFRTADDSAGLPSIGTAVGELTLGDASGRLFYTGNDVAGAVPLSAGTAYQYVVVGPQSLGTDEAWVISWRTADCAGSKFSNHDNSVYGAFEHSPFIFMSAITDLSQSGGYLMTSYISSTDSRDFSLGGYFIEPSGGKSLDTHVDDKTQAVVLTVGIMKRSRFS